MKIDSQKVNFRLDSGHTTLYVSHMTNTIRVCDSVAERIAKAIATAKRTKVSVSEGTGIPYITINRKLKGRGEFSLSELVLIADELGVHPSELLPESIAQRHSSEVA